MAGRSDLIMILLNNPAQEIILREEVASTRDRDDTMEDRFLTGFSLTTTYLPNEQNKKD